MMGLSHGSISAGTSVLLPSAIVASARTHRDSTDFFDQSTTTTFESRRAFSVTWSYASPDRSGPRHYDRKR